MREAKRPLRMSWPTIAHQLRVQILRALGRVNLAKLQAADIQALRNANAEWLLPRSREYLLTILRAALRQAEKWQLV